MRRIRWFLRRFRGFFDRGTLEHDLGAELQFHLNEEADERRAAGLSASEAERAARRSVGNVTLAREEMRQVWNWSCLEHLRQDLRYAVRVLRRRPAFTITALLSLALGIGANTAVFSLLKAIRLDRLPVERPGEIVQIAGARGASTNYPTYATIRDRTRTLSTVFGSDITPPLNFWDGDIRSQATFEIVTDNYFDALGVGAHRGRVFHPPGTGAAPEMAAVISDAYWRIHFAADPSVIGRRIQNFRRDAEWTIVGIAPPHFRGVSLESPADIWATIWPPTEDEDDWRVRMMGRLRPGSTTSQAETEISSILGRSMRVVPGANGYSTLRETLTRPVLLLGFIAALVFIMTCANLANLIVAKTAASHREISVRRAIGASRGRIVRQLATEGLVLAAAGAVLGLVVAYWTSAGLLSFLPSNQSRALPSLSFRLDWTILGFIVLLSLLTGVVCGVVPALRATSTASLRAEATGRQTGSWLGRSLLVGQVAMCTLLLIVAGVFQRSLLKLASQDTGYEAHGLLIADITGFPVEYSAARRDALYEELRAKVGALPGVEIAAYSHVGQMGGSTFDYPLRVPGRVLPTLTSVANEARVTPGFLMAMGTRFVRGRDVSDADRDESQRVAVINEAFARHFGMRGEPIGQRFERTYASGRIDTIEIVGVVRDAKWVTLREDPRPIYYVPYAQSPGRPMVRLAVRGAGDQIALSRAIAQAAQLVDKSLGLPSVVPFTDIVNRTLVTERLVAHVSTAFGALGVLIACIGLYGVLAYAVVRRRREIGVRIAIGATPGSVEWMIFRESLLLLAIGFAIGMPTGIFVVRLVSSLLFQLSPNDPLTIAATLATLTVATVAAAYLPASRAARIDPIHALRED